VVVTATGGTVKIGNLSGTTAIATGFSSATTGGAEICIEGTQAQINAALKTLQTSITAGQEKVSISLDVQPGGAVFNPANGHYYSHVSHPSGISWTAAKAEAETKTFAGMKGYLATVTNAAENQILLAKVAANGWLGMSDQVTEGTFKWESGPEAGNQLSYTNWTVGQPDNAGNEDFGMMFAGSAVPSGVTAGQWNDLPNSVNLTGANAVWNTVGYFIEYGGMPTDRSTVKSGVRTMTVYATEALANVEMTLNDFVQAGVTGVTAANLAAVNEVMRHKALSDTDTNPKLQSVVDGLVAAIGKIENYNNAANGVSTLSEADYAAAGIAGVDTNNLSAINAKILALSTGGADTHAEIQAVVSQSRIQAYADATSAGTLSAPTKADYHALGIYAVDDSNLAFVNQFAQDAASGLADDKTEIARLVQEALEKRSAFVAVEKIAAYAHDDGQNLAVYPAPTATDYFEAGVRWVTSENLAAVNAKLAEAGSATNYAATNTTAEIQAIVKQLAVDKIAAYANDDGVSSPTPSLLDYQNAGLTMPNDSAITAKMIPALNELFAQASVGADAGDTHASTDVLQQAVIDNASAKLSAIAKFIDYAGGGALAPTVQDYADAGALGVTSFNVGPYNTVVQSVTGGSLGVDTSSEIAKLAALQRLSDFALDPRLVRAGGDAFEFFPHDLTSNNDTARTSTTQGGGEFIWSNWNTGGFEPRYAFDGSVPNSSTNVGVVEALSVSPGGTNPVLGWRDTTNPEPLLLKDIIFKTRYGFADRFPKSWVLEGFSAETQTWVQLNATTLSTLASTGLTDNGGSEPPQTYTLHVNASTPCFGYRIKFTDTFDPGDVLNLAELYATVQRIEVRTSPAFEEYVSAGVTGVDASTVYAMNNVLATAGLTAPISLATINAKVASAKSDMASALATIQAYADADPATNPTPVSLVTYLTAGALAVTADDLNALNAAVIASDSSALATTASLESLAETAKATQDARYAVVSNFLNGVANASTPSFEDYHLAGVSALDTFGQPAVAAANLYLSNLVDNSMGVNLLNISNSLATWRDQVTSLYQGVKAKAPDVSWFDDATEQAALWQAVFDAAGVVEFSNLADYQANGVSNGIQLTAAEINLLLPGQSFATDSNLSDILSHLTSQTTLPQMSASANYTEAQAKAYQLEQILTSDAYVSSVSPANSGDTTPAVRVELVDAAVGDTMIIINENGTQSSFVLTQTEINAKASVKNVSEGTNVTANDVGVADDRAYAVQIVHLDTNNLAVRSDDYLYQS